MRYSNRPPRFGEGFILDFIRSLFSGVFRKKNPLEEKVGLRKRLLLNRLKKAEENNDSKKIQSINRRLQKLDEVKSNILVRYVCKELFLYFFVCFLFFVAIFFVNQLLLIFENLLRKRVPVLTVARLILYYMPAIIAQSAPFATLLGFLMCLGRMVTDNEILILRASGQRYSLILIPVLIMGLLISLFSFMMNDYFLPIGNMKSQELTSQIAASNPAVELEPNSVKRMDDATIVIGDVDETQVSDLIFFDTDRNGQLRVIVAGESDVSKSNDPGVLMQLIMNDSVVVFLNPSRKMDYDVLEADTMTMNIFKEDFGLGGSGIITPREMTAYDLYKRIDEMKRTGSSAKTINNYMVEFNKKFSIPFGSIFFAILAFPLALVFGKKDGQTLGLIFGLIISVGYWAATIMGQMLGLRGGANSYLVTWSPNIVIGVLGILLYLRLKRK